VSRGAIRVLIADDHAVVRTGIAHVLATAGDIELVGAAGDGAEAVALAARCAPDVVVMDLSMPQLDGIEATRGIRESVPEARVVILTAFSERDRILQALAAGAVGYLLKDAEPAELLAGIRAAAGLPKS
jgi:DNA-binding NarL/FixJ family response regulator